MVEKILLLFFTYVEDMSKCKESAWRNTVEKHIWQTQGLHLKYTGVRKTRIVPVWDGNTILRCEIKEVSLAQKYKPLQDAEKKIRVLSGAHI